MIIGIRIYTSCAMAKVTCSPIPTFPFRDLFSRCCLFALFLCDPDVFTLRYFLYGNIVKISLQHVFKPVPFSSSRLFPVGSRSVSHPCSWYTVECRNLLISLFWRNVENRDWGRPRTSWLDNITQWTGLKGTALLTAMKVRECTSTQASSRSSLQLSDVGVLTWHDKQESLANAKVSARQPWWPKTDFDMN